MSFLARRLHNLPALSNRFIGAGEGNRTLVISLEGSRRANIFNAFSDKSPSSAALCHKRNFRLSECRERRDGSATPTTARLSLSNRSKSALGAQRTISEIVQPDRSGAMIEAGMTYRESDAFRASRAKTARKRYWRDPEKARQRLRDYHKRKARQRELGAAPHRRERMDWPP
jgi:hypothetical protein